MPDNKTCFVVMGFGKKTDYQSGRVLDLDKSYQYIIKPAAQQAGFECKRADEIVHSGLIDVPMYEQLLLADVVIADISTSNTNAFYELGVRHALRPYTTITIAEDKMVFPFDITHLAIRKYRHLGDGIDYGEVERMRSVLVDALQTIVASPTKDSPVYTFFSDLTPPARKEIEKAVAQSSPSAAGFGVGNVTSREKLDETASDLMSRAERARKNSDFATAIALLTAVRAMAPQDPFVIQRLTLATYKSEQPDKVMALRKAQVILNDLEPNASNDAETLGLWGAIHKRLWEVEGERKDLDTALSSYEKGFYLKNDYYNGINLAYLYNLRASISSGAQAAADNVIAGRIRTRVIAICDAWLEEEEKRREQNKSLAPGPWIVKEELRSAEEEYWVLASKAEAYLGLGEEIGWKNCYNSALTLNPADYMVASTDVQMEKLKGLLSAARAAG